MARSIRAGRKSDRTVRPTVIVDTTARMRKLTTALAHMIAEHCRAGLLFENACELEHVPLNVGNRWLTEGLARIRQIDACERDGVEPPEWTDKARFAANVMAAEARRERDMVNTVWHLATSPDVDDAVRLRAATWYLARMAPHRYGEHIATGEPAIAPPSLTDDDVIDIVVERIDDQIERKRKAIGPGPNEDR